MILGHNTKLYGIDGLTKLVEQAERNAQDNRILPEGPAACREGY